MSSEPKFPSVRCEAAAKHRRYLRRGELGEFCRVVSESFLARFLEAESFGHTVREWWTGAEGSDCSYLVLNRVSSGGAASVPAPHFRQL
jgi:hypothetical protein